MQLHNFDGTYFELGSFLDYGPSRNFTNHETISPIINNILEKLKIIWKSATPLP